MNNTKFVIDDIDINKLEGSQPCGSDDSIETIPYGDIQRIASKVNEIIHYLERLSLNKK